MKTPFFHPAPDPQTCDKDYNLKIYKDRTYNLYELNYRSVITQCPTYHTIVVYTVSNQIIF